jgi:hypothetical protein
MSFDDVLEDLDRVRAALALLPASGSWGLRASDRDDGSWEVVGDAAAFLNPDGADVRIASCPDERTGRAVFELVATAKRLTTALERALVRLDAALAHLSDEDRRAVTALLAEDPGAAEQARQAGEALRSLLDDHAVDREVLPPPPPPGHEPSAADRHRRRPWRDR